MNKKTLLLLITFVFSIASFSQLSYQLSNKFWRLKNAQINGESYSFESKISEAPTLQFSGNNIRGNGGCNAYHSKFTIDGNSITIASIMSTKMACSSLELNENAYFNALSQNHIINYNESQNELIMTNETGDKLYFYSLFTKPKTIETSPMRQRIVPINEEDPVRYARASRHHRDNDEDAPRGRKGKKSTMSKKEIARQNLLEKKMNSKKGKLTKKEKRELMALQSKEKKMSKDSDEDTPRKGKKGKKTKKELAEEKKNDKKSKHSKKDKKDKKDKKKDRDQDKKDKSKKSKKAKDNDKKKSKKRR